MANKAYLLRDVDTEQERVVYECPGCERSHCIDPKRWKWNGSLEAPTFSPSVLCEPSMPQHRCHHFVENGRIRFLSDCHHKLAGQIVDLPDSEWEK